LVYLKRLILNLSKNKDLTLQNKILFLYNHISKNNGLKNEELFNFAESSLSCDSVVSFSFFKGKKDTVSNGILS
jgi:hypothetical protein